MNQNAQNTPDGLRRRLRQQRSALPDSDRSRGALLMRGRLYTWLATRRSALIEQGRPPPRHIAAFWALPDEPDLQGLLRQWAMDDELSVSLPVVTGPAQPLAFRLWTPDTPMLPGPYGILEPEGPPAPAPDVILVPTLGYTRQGDRIGYGGGYYDRTLAALKAGGHPFISVGIAWASGDLSGEPHQPQPHDIRLDAILTDKGWALAVPEP